MSKPKKVKRMLIRAAIEFGLALRDMKEAESALLNAVDDARQIGLHLSPEQRDSK